MDKVLPDYRKGGRNELYCEGEDDVMAKQGDPGSAKPEALSEQRAQGSDGASILGFHQGLRQIVRCIERPDR